MRYSSQMPNKTNPRGQFVESSIRYEDCEIYFDISQYRFQEYFSYTCCLLTYLLDSKKK